MTSPITHGTCDTSISDGGVCDTLDRAEASIGESPGQVVHLFGEVVHEGVQAEGPGWGSQEGFHEGCRRLAEVVPGYDGETGGGNDRAQLLGGNQVAQRRSVGPRERVVETACAWPATGDVP